MKIVVLSAMRVLQREALARCCVTPAASSTFDFLIIETQAVLIAQHVLSTAHIVSI
jgi:hypothetical protein